MELRHLKYFTAVAEELNFRRAAENLHVSQPSLSIQIKQLEEEIGAQLLNRNTHGVILTAAGTRFLEDCRRILLDAEDSTRIVKRIARGEEGRLSIGFVSSLGHGLLPGILRAYRKKYPDVELQLAEMDTTQQMDALHANRLDLGFIGLGLPRDTADLQLTLVAQEKLVAVLPQDHALLQRRPRVPKFLRLSALAKESFLLSARQNAPIYNPWIVTLCQQAGFQPHVVQETGQPVTVLNYVAAGLGVTVLPAQFGRLSTVGVCFIPLAPPTPSYRYYAAWSPKNRHSALQHFVEIAKTASRR
ncbi:MAG: LysR substrate-binding domain-containing protein [Chthoniobacterales bacterium]